MRSRLKDLEATDPHLHLFGGEWFGDEQGTTSLEAARLFDQGNKELEAREYVKAARLFERAALKDPQWVAPLLNLAGALRLLDSRAPRNPRVVLPQES